MLIIRRYLSIYLSIFILVASNKHNVQQEL